MLVVADFMDLGALTVRRLSEFVLQTQVMNIFQ